MAATVSRDDETVLVDGGSSTSKVYHLPSADDPTQPRCHIVRQTDRSWHARPRSTVVFRRVCKSCAAEKE